MFRMVRLKADVDRDLLHRSAAAHGCFGVLPHDFFLLTGPTLVIGIWHTKIPDACIGPVVFKRYDINYLSCHSLRLLMTVKCETVPGRNKTHQVKIFTLSTCGWCKKTKELLKSLDVQYEYVDVDKLSGDDIIEATEEVKKYNPNRTYPTIVIDNGKHVILGFKDSEIKEKLGRTS